MEISIGTVLLLGFITSLGNGIGTPIGNFVYKRYLEKFIERHAEKIEERAKLLKNGGFDQ